MIENFKNNNQTCPLSLKRGKVKISMDKNHNLKLLNQENQMIEYSDFLQYFDLDKMELEIFRTMEYKGYHLLGEVGVE